MQFLKYQGIGAVFMCLTKHIVMRDRKAILKEFDKIIPTDYDIEGIIVALITVTLLLVFSYMVINGK